MQSDTMGLYPSYLTHNGDFPQNVTECADTPLVAKPTLGHAEGLR